MTRFWARRCRLRNRRLENPPSGAILDYYLENAAGHIKLEILDAEGTRFVRGFSSDDRKEPKHLTFRCPKDGSLKPQALD